MPKNKQKKPRVLFYDIETTPLLAYIWRLGKQAVRHNQLHKDRDMYNIICITYCWNDRSKPDYLTWDYDTQDSSKMIEQFDALVTQADIVIGKNSDRFDIKHINSQRMLHGLMPIPDWSDSKDDLEKQMRRYFALPSYSLDYISKKLGCGGKMKMEFDDWINIVEQNGEAGIKAYKKMIKYGLKDISDTRKVWNYMCAHFKPKFNMSTFTGEMVCTHCGSDDIIKNGLRYKNKSVYQRYFCHGHTGSAGQRLISKDNEPVGKMGV